MVCRHENYLLEPITCVTFQFFLGGLSEKNKDSSLKRNSFLVQPGRKKIVQPTQVPVYIFHMALGWVFVERKEDLGKDSVCSWKFLHSRPESAEHIQIIPLEKRIPKY